MTNDGQQAPGVLPEEPSPTEAAGRPEETAGEREGDEVARRAEEYLAALQRERADFLNYKRRVEQDRRSSAALTTARTVGAFFPVLDDLYLAAEAVDPRLSDLPWVRGMLAVRRKFEAVLESLGVQEIDIEGRPFDPRVCEAVMQAPGPENTVLKVLQRGYILGEQLVRPARVIVGRGGPELAQTESPSEQQRESPTAEEE